MQLLYIFIRLSAIFAFILCNFNVYKWENAYITKIIYFKNFNDFFHVFIWAKEGGGGLR